MRVPLLVLGTSFVRVPAVTGVVLMFSLCPFGRSALPVFELYYSTRFGHTHLINLWEKAKILISELTAQVAAIATVAPPSVVIVRSDDNPMHSNTPGSQTA